MKYSFAIFIGIISVATASSEIFKDVQKIDKVTYTLIPTDGLLDSSLADEVNRFVVEKVAEFNEELEKFNNISENTQIEIDGILEDAKTKIEEFFKKIMDKIMELKRRGGIYKKCAEQYETELKEARLAALNAFKECASSISKALKDFAVEVGTEAARITKNVLYLVEIATNCYNQDGTINQIKCAFKAIKQVMDTIIDIVKAIKNLVTSIIENTKAIVAAVKNCNDNYVKVVIAKFEDYDNKVAACYKLEAFFT
ncbi:uncharacterized protein LOC129612053 [Condylostylus longicornis]|uniref:uncharacterized protein LOC129612053 n=1 Tax=Condylostylus longicornis TaxID=2530218 RepID=UPI00244DB55D|nr:uncharacterized protein LOC129612053 [Condylostylus longicornis]